MITVVLALAASLCWGTSDFLAGLESRRASAWAAAIVSQPAALFGALAAALVLGGPPPSLLLLGAPLLGGSLGALATVAQYRALSLAPMSLVAPITAASAIVPLAVAVVQGERPAPLQLLGIAITIIGVTVVCRYATCDVRAAGGSRRAIVLALAAAVGFGLVLVAYAWGDADPFWTVAAARLSWLVTTGLLVAGGRPRLRLRPAAVPSLIVVGLLLAAAGVLFTTASMEAPLSVVAVLGWLGAAVTVLYANLLLHERMRPLQWFAVVLILAGIACQATG